MANPACVVAMVIGALLIPSFARAINTKVTGKYCSDNKYQGGTAYASSVATVLNDMMTTTANSLGFNRITQAGKPGSWAFGYSTCRSGLSINDCSMCTFVTVTLIQGNCEMSVNAKLVTPDCTIAYGQNPL